MQFKATSTSFSICEPSDRSSILLPLHCCGKVLLKVTFCGEGDRSFCRTNQTKKREMELTGFLCDSFALSSSSAVKLIPNYSSTTIHCTVFDDHIPDLIPIPSLVISQSFASLFAAGPNELACQSRSHNNDDRISAIRFNFTSSTSAAAVTDDRTTRQRQQLRKFN